LRHHLELDLAGADLRGDRRRCGRQHGVRADQLPDLMQFGEDLQRGRAAGRRVADDGQVLHAPLAQGEEQVGRPGLRWPKGLHQDRRSVHQVIDRLERGRADALCRHRRTTATHESDDATARSPLVFARKR
jgi:hypothetical protein